MAQIRSITSETLEAQIRDLLPSQSGFSEDLQATNVITPIIDLTSAAEGNLLPTELQNAWDFATSFARQRGAGTVAIANTPGFYKVLIVYAYDAGSPTANTIQLTDGLSTKTVWGAPSVNAGSNPDIEIQDEIYIYLRAGDTLNLVGVTGEMCVSSRQVADVNGVLTDPLGFTPQ